MTHLPLIGRLAPLDSWWTMWRHFFASWSPNGVGTGSPGMPGYAVLAFAGTFVLGRMGILPRLALIFAIPIGAIGISRLLKRTGLQSRPGHRRDRLHGAAARTRHDQSGSHRRAARRGGSSVRRASALRVDGRARDSGPSRTPIRSPFGHRGWRTTLSGQRMVAVMLIALLTAMAPATLIVGHADRSSASSSRDSSRRDEGVNTVAPVAIPRLAVAQRRDPPAAPHRRRGDRRRARTRRLRPGARTVVGAVLRRLAAWCRRRIRSLVGRLVAAGRGAASVSCSVEGERRRIATKAASIATLTLIVAALDVRHWMGSFAPDLDVLLALYMVMLALLIGLGVSALENDLRQAGFGWRQVAAGLARRPRWSWRRVPFAAIFASGRFDLPDDERRRVVEHAGARQSSGGYRVLVVGRPVGPAPRGMVGRARARRGDVDEWSTRAGRRSSRRPTRAPATSSWTPSSRRSRARPFDSASCSHRPASPRSSS